MKRIAVAVSLALGALSVIASATALQLKNMRAVHMEGNWGGNVQGIRSTVSGFLRTAPSLTAGASRVTVSRSTFVDSSGKTIVNDVAQIRFDMVVVGSRPFTQAGFWLGRNVDTQDIFLQFRPSLDSSLAGIPGFSADITLQMSANGRSVDTSQIDRASGAAFDYVVAVIAHARELLDRAPFVIQAPATFDQASVSTALQALRTRVVRR